MSDCNNIKASQMDTKVGGFVWITMIWYQEMGPPQLCDLRQHSKNKPTFVTSANFCSGKEGILGYVFT